MKGVFWEWFNNGVEHEKYKLEMWTLLNKSSQYFSEDEYNKIIDWIESIDYRISDPETEPETAKKYNAYKRKEWLLCLQNNKKAQELYEQYHRENKSEIKHPGFSYWSGGFYTVPRYSYPDKEKLCNNLIQTIQNFKPPKKRMNHFERDKDFINGLSHDLSVCVEGNPDEFSEEIDGFKILDYNYKESLITGFTNAWQDNKKFNWSKVLNFIKSELTTDFFKLDEYDRQLFVSAIARLIEGGTQKDSNAFDKKYLPKAHKILLTLLGNKYEEDINSHDLIFHTLNSANGKVLHALINYALRYGRLHSDQSEKWEKEIKDFFTGQLGKNDKYSESVFTILGYYFHQLEFLDKQWVKGNFNKIFPLENEELWKASITAYFFYSNTVYEDIYNLFKKHKHIQKMLGTDFEHHEIKSKLISFVCIAYINNIDEDTIFDIIKSKNSKNILNIVSSMQQIYGKEQTSKIQDKIKIIWREICSTYEEDNSEDAKEIFINLNAWFVFLNKIVKKDMELLKHTVRHIEQDHQAYTLMMEMAKLSENYPKEIYEIYKVIIENKIYPTYEEEDIKKILSNLGKRDKIEIVNRYRENGIYIFNQC